MYTAFVFLVLGLVVGQASAGPRGPPGERGPPGPPSERGPPGRSDCYRWTSWRNTHLSNGLQDHQFGSLYHVAAECARRYRFGSNPLTRAPSCNNHRMSCKVDYFDWRNGKTCPDYRARFLGPCDSSPRRSDYTQCEWSDYYDSDTPTYFSDGDLELPTMHTCEAGKSIVGVDCRTLDGKDWTTTGDRYTCTPKHGGQCSGREQPEVSEFKTPPFCADYKVRFLCCKPPPPPPTPDCSRGCPGEKGANGLPGEQK